VYRTILGGSDSDTPGLGSFQFVRAACRMYESLSGLLAQKYSAANLIRYRL